MRISMRNIQTRSFFPWPTLVKILMVLSSSSQQLRHHGCVKWSFILYFFLLILVGWATRRIWESNWRPGSSTVDWESRFTKRKAEDDYYYYFLWHSGRWLIFLKLIIFFIFWYEIFLCWRWFETCQGRFTSFLMTAFSWLDARIIFLLL